MPIVRARLVDPAVTPGSVEDPPEEDITRCVRRAFLLGEGASDRKLWIDRRLRELADAGCEVQAYSPHASSSRALFTVG